ncbi:MAG: DUF5103 domain-containing protein [Paludibacteraceae bacterium]|nr:DUF5103 domain-containing protein [Paludibacteraceae bacterium]
MKRIGLILVVLSLWMGVCAQTHTHVFNEQIRTLRVERRVLELADGIVDGSDPENTLHISFDEMSHDVHFYTYSVQMLGSELLSGEYLKGFTTRDITDYEHSINTSREYTHYWFEFPNEDMAITKSGNYRLTVYEDGNTENRVAEVDFCVVEPIVKIASKVRSHTDIEFNGRYQQVDIDVDLQDAAINYQPSEFRVVVTQNNRQDNAVVLTQPTFMEPKRLRYINNKALIFEGGNEYHHFDAFSCFYAGYGIDRVYHEMGDYHVSLFPTEITKGQYIHEFDSDGRFVVNAERTADSDTEAEYMWVYWTLPADKPWFDGALYIGGELFHNELNLRNRMQYDAEARCYWLTALVKQGGYDYQYWFVEKYPQPSAANPQPKTTTQRVDGSYWQTENEYAVYLYWRPFGERYERLIGVQIQKSTL